MIFFLITFLSRMGYKVPFVFSYVSTRMVLAAMTALLLNLVLGPWFIKKLYEWKIGQHIRMKECPLLGHLHRDKQNTPTMGGLLIIGSLLLSLVLWMDLQHLFTLILGGATLWLGVIGGIDDGLKIRYKSAKGLSGKKKLFFQLLLALVVWVFLICPSLQEGLGEWIKIPLIKSFSSSGGSVLNVKESILTYYIPFYKNPLFVLSGLGAVLGLFITFFVITGSSNAVNLSDGLDGLASGLVLPVALVLIGFAFCSNHISLSRYLHILYIEGSGEIAVYLSALFGSVLGFLWYNGHPAQVFMGDTGSLTLGGVMGVSALLLRRELLLALVGGLFVLEALSVILQVASYRLRGKRIFLCSPIHHHFEYKGWPETKIVLRFWIVGLILSLIGLASLKFQ